MFWLGLASKPRLWLGLAWLWLQILQAKAKAMDGGLAWLGFGSSRGFRDHIVGCPDFRKIKSRRIIHLRTELVTPRRCQPSIGCAAY
ncbi:hypothetical protein B0H13DRAFT_2001800 [Mycena leptocephala]|nr:hypothetical protein B0H13DRAFT_2028130 [Mycena leptocephala]KAJ7914783.1 hypothetical protein B0H13DRAFT_2001800 [Mycena leptocephala]